MKTLKDIRQEFLEYFERHDHRLVPSSSLVPHDDPTLLFTNAGMVPFKDIFTGQKRPPHPRAASAQKCLRAGGKHNDLENVGYTARHHTFFEMLGNFSFGDYFKEDAILFAWELITQSFSLDPERLLITIYHDDDEALSLWKKVSGLHEKKILRISTDDNFWSMGDRGPCGPCSEIFYDHGDHLEGAPPGSGKAEGDRFIEIWNLVFMQYDQGEDGARRPLPSPAIDTGMGLERMAALMQGTHDNYQTDLFRALIEASADITGVASDGDRAVSHRVIADHLRASSFLIAEGIQPSNVGRGYVLRRILRRAMRHAHLLGMKEPLLHRLVPVLNEEMGDAYPELIRAEASTTQTLQDEEEKFHDLLERGMKLLQKEKARVKKGKLFSGDAAFKLYDTYGFPIDLTEDILRQDGIAVDRDAFEKSMEEARLLARAHWQGSGEAETDKIWFDLQEAHGATEFLGYESSAASGSILAIISEGLPVEALREGMEASLLLEKTPFYAESGGQVGDSGIIKKGEALFSVQDTKKRVGSLHLHLGRMEKGTLKKGDIVEASIDADRRLQIRANHSATHLLNEALRRVLGEHVQQKGSLVAPDRLRFDFSHQKALEESQISEIEEVVNGQIRQNHEVMTRLLPREKAIKEGAMALFGEKYDDEVRVLFMGSPREEGSKKDAFSVELCGGTHVRRLGDIAFFRIVSESAIGSGVRRVEALTGEAALLWVKERDHMLREAATLLKVAPEKLAERVGALLEERQKMEHVLQSLRKQAAIGSAQSGEESHDIEKVGKISFMAQSFSDMPAQDLRALADEAKARLGSGVVALVSVSEGKASLVVGVTKDLTKKYDASLLAKEGAGILGGKGGGGRADLAFSGGPDGAKAKEALSAIKARLI